MRHTKYFIFAFLLLLVVFLNLPIQVSMRIKSIARDNIAPFQEGLSLVIRRIQNTVTYLSTVSGNAENSKLQTELATLRNDVRRLDVLQKENNKLRKQLGFSLSFPSRLLPSEVVGRGDMTGWRNVLRLNKGTRDGVSGGSPVITVDGLIGRIISVSERGCEVLLITDPNFKVSCSIERTDTLGIVRGNGVALAGKSTLNMIAATMPCKMDYVSQSYILKDGDRISTSGLGSGFPKNIPVGYVHSASVDESGLCQEIEVIPFVNIPNAEHLFILMKDTGNASIDSLEEPK